MYRDTHINATCFPECHRDVIIYIDLFLLSIGFNCRFVLGYGIFGKSKKTEIIINKFEFGNKILRICNFYK